MDTLIRQENYKKKIFIVDDHPIVRRGLSQFINNHSFLEVCGDAEDANSAIAALNDCTPDVVIVDINLRGISGIELIKAIRNRYRNIKIIALSMYEESDYVERAIRAGAIAYVVKSDNEEVIIEAIRTVLGGKTYLSEGLKDKVISNYLWSTPLSGDIAIQKLSDREFDIFKLMGKGFSTRQIASALNLSVSTIGTYRERIKNKLNIADSSQLMKQAILMSHEE